VSCRDVTRNYFASFDFSFRFFLCIQLTIIITISIFCGSFFLTFSHSLSLYLYITQVKHFLDNEAKGTKVIGATSMDDMVSKLKSPRRVMLLVKGELKMLRLAH
jgi:hypothetical protein